MKKFTATIKKYFTARVKGSPKVNDLKLANRIAFWNQNPLKGIFPIVIPGTGINFLMKCENDDTVIKTLYWDGFYGGWEPFSIRIWCRLSARSNVVADVGSYTGIYALMAAFSSAECKVHAFEASPRNCARVIENVRINNLDKSIIVNNLAISNRSGTVTFFEHYADKGILSSINSLVEMKKSNVVKIDTNATSIDEYFKDSGLDLLKIDTEGAEILALQGMKSLFGRLSPHLLIESNSLKEFSAVFENIPRDYNCYQIIENEFRLLKVVSPRMIKSFRDRNFLFTKMRQVELEDFTRSAVL